jgi:Ig-like domain CHU_C associated
MYKLFRSTVRSRVLSSRLSSLLLLFQRSPLVQILFPEARMLGGAGLGEITKWTIATVVGLGAYDSVSGATTITQLAPSAGSTTVPATAGSALSFVFQLLNYPDTPGSWTVTGTLPAGLTHTNAKGNTIDSITGVPTQSGSFPITVRAWSGSNASGDSFSKSFTISVTGTTTVAPAITTNPASVTINSGGTTTLTVAASGTSPTFQWYRGASGVTTTPVSGATSASFTTPALTATTLYWARASNSAGTANSNAATVTVRIPPSITTQPNPVTVNSGQTATFTVVAAGTSPTYQWYQGASGVTTSPVAGATSATFTTTALSATTSYWVRATNVVSSVNSNTVTATVITPPLITAQPASTTINTGNTVTFTVAASGTAPTFQWYQGTSPSTANPIAGATADTFTTPVLTASTGYWVRAINPAGNADSGTATVTVNSPPAITTEPAPITINSGQTATFTVVAAGTSPTFQWYQGASGVTTNPVAGATSATFTTTALSATTSYWVRATNIISSADSNSVTATVITPPLIITQPVSATINTGNTVTFTVAASGTAPSFQWYQGTSPSTANPIAGATADTFTTPVLTASTGYWVRAINPAGNADSGTATVTVNSPPAIITEPLSGPINSGASVTLVVAASGTAPTFQWYLGNAGDTANPIANATSQTFTTPVLVATTRYWVRATNGLGIADSQTATLTVQLAPVFTTPPVTTTINSGATATFTFVATGTSPTFQWYLGNSGDTSQPISNAVGSTFTTPALTATTNYWVRASSVAGASDSATVSAIVITPPALTTVPVSVTINSGQTTTFTVAASGTAPAFQWYLGTSGDTSHPVASATAATFTTPALTTDTSYWVRASNAAGAADSGTVTVSVIATPAIIQAPESTSINQGNTATLTIAVTGTSPAFQWYLGNSGDTSQPIPTATAASFTTPALTADTSYWVRASNLAGNADSATVTVSVITPPVITTPPASIIINRATTTTLTIQATGTAPVYQWYRGVAGVTTTPVAGATAPSFTTPALTATTSFWVRATNAAGTADSGTAVVTVRIPPAITRQPAPVTIASGRTAKLRVVATGTSPTYQWYKGPVGNTKSPVKGAKSATLTTPALKVTTSFWVRVTNPAGKVNSRAVTVTVKAAAPRAAAPAAARSSAPPVSQPGTFAIWQNARFSTEQLADVLISGPAADPDGDGLANIQEYLHGLSPLTGNPLPLPAPDLTAGQPLSIEFTARLASGPGYTGLTRHYALEAADTPDSWAAVRGYDNIVGNDQQVTYTAPATAPHRFYRLGVWLAP